MVPQAPLGNSACNLRQMEGALKTLTWPAFLSIILSMFAISIGYGVVLPILPFQIERVAGRIDATELSWHTGLLTGVYILAIFIFAPLWGRVSDSWGRRPVMLSGLIGFAVTVALVPAAGDLPLLYASRFVSGVFAAGITPVAYALVGDYSPSKAWRARRFTLVNIAGTAGVFVGPLLGGLAVRLSGDLFISTNNGSLFLALLAPAILALVAAVMLWMSVPDKPHQMSRPAQTPMRLDNSVMHRLWIVAFVTALAVGSFEVGLSLRAKQSLGLDAAHIGAMFAECSLVMFIAQALVFSPLMDPARTRWLIWPALALLAAGLATVPLADTSIAMTVAVALIAASAGVLSPIATYWASLGTTETQGADLGRMTAASSLGQALGSAGGGLLFNIQILPDAGFIVTAFIVGASLFAGFPLARLLTPTVAGETPSSQPQHASRIHPRD
jgi:DHA1 family multidrug resistance protein-like MFS transporter